MNGGAHFRSTAAKICINLEEAKLQLGTFCRPTYHFESDEIIPYLKQKECFY